MGWTYTHKDSAVSASEFLKQEFTWSNDKASVKVLDVAIVGMRTAYLAVERKGVNMEGQPIDEVFAMICMLDYKKDDYYNFGYKDMTESMHPYYYDCPKRILDLLTPTDNELANEWRQKCREKLASKAKVPKLVTGHYLKLNEPMKFNNGEVRDTFYIYDAKRRQFRAHQNGFIDYRIPKRVLDKGFQVLTSEELAAQR